MKYIADDGEIFSSEQACTEHEQLMNKRGELKAEVEKYASMLNYANDRARARAVTQIMGWVDYDLRQRPERYGHEFPEIPPAVAAVK